MVAVEVAFPPAVSVTLVGLKVTETPVGKDDADSVTVPAKPPRLVIVIVEVLVEPALTEAWEKTKTSFKSLLDTVFGSAKLSSNPQDILEYHNTRNALYHDALPITVETSKLKDYIKQSQVILKELLGRSYSHAQWKNSVNDTRVRMVSKEKTTLIEYAKVDDSHVKIIAEKSLSKDVDAIELAVYGYAKELGRKPTLDELEASLSFSGNPIHPTSRLLNQIAQLRVRGILNPKELSLTKKATDTLKRKFFIPQE